MEQMEQMSQMEKGRPLHIHSPCCADEAVPKFDGSDRRARSRWTTCRRWSRDAHSPGAAEYIPGAAENPPGADVEADGADEREAALHGSQDAVQHWKVEDLILVNTMHQVIKWQLKGRFEEMQLIAHMLESQCHA